MRASDFDWKTYTILVVEDVETNLMFIKAALGKTGIRIIWASDGFEAIKLVQENDNIDVVLMDLRMPNLDGFRATEVIKNVNRALQQARNLASAKDMIFIGGSTFVVAEVLKYKQ